ncbi:MAG: DUF2513 domain-containing protein [Opitutus sp.]|nr:DUF2513 domain-containing protein [Opitutus sp.]
MWLIFDVRQKQTMKRDLEIIRTIILNVEADKYQYGDYIRVEGVDPTICAHHVALILDAGLAEGRVIKSVSYGIVHGQIDRLTNSGHDFCEGIRQDTIWTKVRERIIKPGAAYTISAVVEMVRVQVQKQVFGAE